MVRTVNVYEAKTQLSKLLEAVERGEEIVIARAGRPVAELRAHRPQEPGVIIGGAKSLVDYDDAVFEHADAEIEDLFYGTD